MKVPNRLEPGLSANPGGDFGQHGLAAHSAHVRVAVQGHVARDRLCDRVDELKPKREATTY